MSLFNKLYDATEELCKKWKKPSLERSVKRAFEEKKDKLTDSLHETKDRLFELRQKLVKGEDVLNEILQLQVQIEDINLLLTILEEERKIMFEYDEPKE